MERPDNLGDQSNSNGNEEIQLGSTGNQRNPSDTDWTTKARYRRDATILRSRRGNAPHTKGVALMLSKEARNAPVRWESHISGIIKASFKKRRGAK
ncbi:unnamed protein product [Schistosoma curassoni]|uniref:Reverse transcriptase n=1 Tax=Schistosoma curassoni TaxID=6186 RepID=A0A183L783_9TREM|nr:unnamed protein product [Schistosoma curassoni]